MDESQCFLYSQKCTLTQSGLRIEKFQLENKICRFLYKQTKLFKFNRQFFDIYVL